MGGKSTKKNDFIQDKSSSAEISDKNTGLGSEGGQLLEEDYTPAQPGMSDRENQNMDNIANNSNRQQAQTASPPNLPFCGVHGGNESTTIEFLHLNDPKNYKFLPSQFTEQIRAAGKLTAKSQNVSNLF